MNVVKLGFMALLMGLGLCFCPSNGLAQEVRVQMSPGERQEYQQEQGRLAHELSAIPHGGVELTYEAHLTQHMPLKQVPPEWTSGMSESEIEAYNQTLQGVRSQTVTHIYTLGEDVWGWEMVTGPGEVYPVGMHQKYDIDFKGKSAYYQRFAPAESSGAMEPFDQLTNMFHALIRYRSTPELLGIYDRIPNYDSSMDVLEQKASINNETQWKRLAEPSGRVVLVAQENGLGELTSVTFFEADNTVRSVEYGEYESNPELGMSIPQSFLVKRYGSTNLLNINEDYLVDEYQFTLISVELVTQ